MTESELGVYHIEIFDPIYEETDTTVVVAFSLIEAMEKAVRLLNDSFNGDLLELKHVTVARALTTEMLFFSQAAKNYLRVLYGDKMPQQEPTP